MQNERHKNKYITKKKNNFASLTTYLSKNLAIKTNI